MDESRKLQKMISSKALALDSIKYGLFWLIVELDNVREYYEYHQSLHFQDLSISQTRMVRKVHIIMHVW